MSNGRSSSVMYSSEEETARSQTLSPLISLIHSPTHRRVRPGMDGAPAREGNAAKLRPLSRSSFLKTREGTADVWDE